MAARKTSRKRAGRRRPAVDMEREERVYNEIVADAHDADEQAMAWFNYLDETLQFPFSATCIAERAISPLRVGDEVEVRAMGPEDECAREMFVVIRCDRKEGLAVPLAQLEPFDVDEETEQAVADWHYWVRMGYRF